MESGARDWLPAASIPALEQRAAMLASIRGFFAERGVLEVQTPVLAQAAATDPEIESFAVPLGSESLWLQSSPEFHMKRLLAAGCGSIYQIAPAFRREEQGRWHNPEFTLLEWYRPGFDHHQLMDEVELLWQRLSGQNVKAERRSYRSLLEEALGLDWNALNAVSLRQALEREVGGLPQGLEFDGLLDAAMGLLIGPRLGRDRPCFVYDYPASQAALARIGPEGWAQRFELYWQGLELANGFHELSNAREQTARFAQDQQRRQAAGQVVPPQDERLLAALAHGLPDCAGVAVGLDRLAALLQDKSALADVMNFPADRA